jgi:hypothetical protein
MMAGMKMNEGSARHVSPVAKLLGVLLFLAAIGLVILALTGEVVGAIWLVRHVYN